MTSFKLLSRSETTSTYSIFSINDYQINPIAIASEADGEKIMNDFLTPENFKHEDFHKIIRLNEDPTRNFLGHALNLEQISLSDFRKFSKNEAVHFFDRQIPKNSLVPLEQEERYLLDKFIDILTLSTSPAFYVISRDFFDTELPVDTYFENYKLLYDGIIYNPYFLVLWLSDKNILHVCEYLSD
ncbi:hypothetical protein CNR22_17325 [Sphingobacteriaceae bacterium]|nr:hypothetical protein CNR22_17325 [Sphingobacteriaceae bacterium]